MFKIIYEYYIVFNKIVWAEKLPFVYSLVFPIIIFVFSNFEWIGSSPQLGDVINYLNIYWAFIIIGVYLNGLGLQLSSFRESGFLKTAAMISGSKYPIFLGMALTQFIFGMVSISIFTIIIGFLVQVSIWKLIITALVTFLISSFPLMLITSSITAIPARQNTITTISNIALFPMVFIAAVRPITENILVETLFALVPADYITQIGIIIKRIIFNEAIGVSIFSVFISSIIYIVVGSYFMTKVKLTSKLSRN